MKYVPINIKTDNTLLNSMIKIKDLIRFAKENNINALTITDKYMFGVMEFYNECISNDIKPIVGTEIEINNMPIILYAKNIEGYKNLLKLNTLIQEKNLDINDLKLYKNKLVCIIPYESKELYNDLKNLYKDLFIGYKNNDEYETLNKDIAIYMNEILYLNKEDKNYLPYLYAIREGKLLEEINITSFNRLLLYDEYINTYPESIHNNEKIYEICNLKFEKNTNLLPKFKCPQGYDSYSYLKHLCKEGLKKIFGDTVKKIYIDRLKYELEIINKMGFCNYFLVVADYVNFAKNKGILVGPGRGSAAGSLVSYCLNITDIDPIKYNLIFERFLNPERITMPDIDIDFEDSRRDEVINYCISKYGIKKVSEIITFGTLASKQAIRDVGRVLNVNLKNIDFICKLIDSKYNLRENLKNNSRISEILQFNNQLKKVYDIAMKIEGIKRHTSIHAAGVVICEYDIDDIVPLYKNDKIYVTAFTMNYLEEIGLLKMDFLALTTLSTIKCIIDEINKNNYIDFNKIPLNDKKAIDIFNKANTLGIFQFESEGMINFLRKLRPNNLEDIIAALALYRPGPMNNIDIYIKRKQGILKINYLHENLINILKPTYGVLIYQEQIMQVANIMAGYSLGEADVLRRAMSKKKEDILIKEQDKFINRAITKGYTKELATDVYNLILKFASYGFNRSHSVSYGIIAYKMAYLKAYYPKCFIKCLLTQAIGSSKNTKDYIYEAKKNNIKIIKPNINISNKNYQIIEDGILMPLSNIKNVGNSIVDSIIEERSNESFKDIFDFIRRTNRKVVNKSVIINLIDAGCFDSFGYNHRTLIEQFDLIYNYCNLMGGLDEELCLKPEIEQMNEYSNFELMKRELDIYGFYLTNHPVTEYRIKYNLNQTISDIELHFDKFIDIIVCIEKFNTTDTKKGDKMCFITGSDELSKIEIILFSKVYMKYNKFNVGDVIKVGGRVEKRFDKYQIIANEIKVLNR